MTRRPFAGLLLLAAIQLEPGIASPALAGEHREKVREVQLTWMSMANWLVEIGDLRIVIDGYITRVPGPPFFHGGGGGLAFTERPVTPDVAAVERVLDAIGDDHIDYILAGHSHFDHTVDVATWAALTGARIIGGKTTCFQAFAQGTPASQCTVVNGGEVLELAPGVTVRVVRWNHSGSHAANPEQHDPVELRAIPTPDPVTGGLRVGVAEDFPNGGGGRMFLFTVDTAGGPVSFFWNNSASAVDLDTPIVIDGVDFGAPRANLAAAMADAGLSSVDLWIGTGGKSVAELVVPILKPRANIPHHWDGLFFSFLAGLPFPFSDPALADFLASSGTRLIVEHQFMDKWRLDATGVTPVPNTKVKAELGFSDVQSFVSATAAAKARAEAEEHDDCSRE